LQAGLGLSSVALLGSLQGVWLLVQWCETCLVVLLLMLTVPLPLADGQKSLFGWQQGPH